MIVNLRVSKARPARSPCHGEVTSFRSVSVGAAQPGEAGRSRHAQAGGSLLTTARAGGRAEAAKRRTSSAGSNVCSFYVEQVNHVGGAGRQLPLPPRPPLPLACMNQLGLIYLTSERGREGDSTPPAKCRGLRHRRSVGRSSQSCCPATTPLSAHGTAGHPHRISSRKFVCRLPSPAVGGHVRSHAHRGTSLCRGAPHLTVIPLRSHACVRMYAPR